MAVNSAIEMFLTRTARLEGRRRLPPHAAQDRGHVIRQPFAVIGRRIAVDFLERQIPSKPALPFSSASRVARDNFSHGILSLRGELFASSCTWCTRLEPAPGPSAPSSSGFEGSTITLSGSNAHVLPIPAHSSQAP